jgi:hypothetical protein
MMPPTPNRATPSAWKAQGNFRVRSRRFLNPVFEIEEWRRWGTFKPQTSEIVWSDHVETRWRRVVNGEFGINTHFVVEHPDAISVHEQIAERIRAGLAL